MRRNRWLFAAPLLWLAISGAAHAQQEPPSGEPTAEKEKTYFDLRRSNNRTTSLIAERYFNLARLQEWSDVTGKSKVTAKYLEHDPELEWVKLQMVRGRGADRVVQEKAVPVAKLSKTCQSRVRQIATLQKKLDELLVAESEADDGRDGETGAAFEDPGAPMTDDRGVEPRTAPGGEVQYGPPENEPQTLAAAQNPTSIEFDDDPDPLGFAEAAANLPPPQVGAEDIPIPGFPPGAGGDVNRPLIDERTPAPGNTTPNDSSHPTSVEELQVAFTKAFDAGDKESLEKLIYWGDSTEEARKITRSSLVDDAGKKRILKLNVEARPGGLDRPDYKWTFGSQQVFRIEYGSDDSATHEFIWPFGEIEGKYYLGAWSPDQPAPRPQR
ncbi:MAG: hypothetical protein WD738_09585 [Pirellulales bacterium]